jgi:AcrR family transcriptional regulator
VDVGRWAPDARERLQDAALALFSENGYEATTVAQIAERANLNRATFFRHFADKREILFGGEDVLGALFADTIRQAPDDADVSECLASALKAADAVMTPEQRRRAAQRRKIAEASVEVRERGLLKTAGIANSVVGSLLERGVEDLTARLGAEMLILAFSVALRSWIESATDEPFSQYSAAALARLRERTLQLGEDIPASPA